jgi:glutamine synthetase type III
LDKALVKGTPAQQRQATADLRRTVDALEYLVDDSRWPLPKYREMLFIC